MAKHRTCQIRGRLTQPRSGSNSEVHARSVAKRSKNATSRNNRGPGQDSQSRAIWEDMLDPLRVLGSHPHGLPVHHDTLLL
eukprot:12083728-Alexandrium_andersonii.AAC.1